MTTAQVRHPVLWGQREEGDPGQHQHGLDQGQVQGRRGQTQHEESRWRLRGPIRRRKSVPQCSGFTTVYFIGAIVYY